MEIGWDLWFYSTSIEIANDVCNSFSSIQTYRIDWYVYIFHVQEWCRDTKYILKQSTDFEFDSEELKPEYKCNKYDVKLKFLSINIFNRVIDFDNLMNSLAFRIPWR